jgi:type IV secretory pathway VirB9-like protein
VKKLVGNLIWLMFFSQCIVPLFAADGARLVKYSQTDVVPIHAKVHFSTLIVLPAEEEILDFTTGDKDYWIINGTHNLCYLHPAQASIRSNLNLVTASGHVYSFLLTEISKEANSEPDLKVFVVPSEESGLTGNLAPATFIRASEAEVYKNELSQLRVQLAQEIQQAQAKANSEIAHYKRTYPAKLQFDYSFSRKATQAPFLVSQIYHDDAFTYVKSSAPEKPAIYELKDSKPSLINFDYENGLYVIPKIIDSGYIVVGKKKVSFTRQTPGKR